MQPCVPTAVSFSANWKPADPAPTLRRPCADLDRTPPARRPARTIGPMMEVRLAHRGDSEAIRAIYNAEVSGSTATFDIVERSAPDQLDWLYRHAGAHPAIVATSGGEVCGFGSLSPYRDRAAYSTSVEDSVYVSEAWRRKGVG